MRSVHYDFQAESSGWLFKSPHTGTADTLGAALLHAEQLIIIIIIVVVVVVGH